MHAATIHNVDQRSSTIRLAHPNLASGGVVEVDQCPAGSPGFQSNTSSVLWSCGERLAWHLCEHPELVRGHRCVELGSGVGLTGAVAASLGAASVLLTDVAEALPLLQRNAARISGALPGGSGVLSVQELLWGDEAAIERAGARAFDVVLGADIVYFQSAPEAADLARTLEGLLAMGGTVVLAYEWREDWETTGAFHNACRELGLDSEMIGLHDTDEDDAVLFLIRRGESAEDQSS